MIAPDPVLNIPAWLDDIDCIAASLEPAQAVALHLAAQRVLTAYDAHTHAFYGPDPHAIDAAWRDLLSANIALHKAKHP